MVGITIHNEVNQSDKAMGFSSRRISYSQKSWRMFDKLSQPNSRYDALDTLIMVVNSYKMPVGFGGDAIKIKVHTARDHGSTKEKIVEVEAEENCLAHALIISIARLDNDPNYIA